jgi:hypothetical protein
VGAEAGAAAQADRRAQLTGEKRDCGCEALQRRKIMDAKMDHLVCGIPFNLAKKKLAKKNPTLHFRNPLLVRTLPSQNVLFC